MSVCNENGFITNKGVPHEQKYILSKLKYVRPQINIF